MTNILRFASASHEFIIKFFKDELPSCKIEFVTDDTELNKFIKCCNIRSLYYLIKGNPKGSCPIDKKYFPLASVDEWKSLQALFQQFRFKIVKKSNTRAT